MTAGTVYTQGWTLDDIDWSKFDRSKLDLRLVAAVKAAALVEFNAPDYVSYLKRVFKNSGPETLSAIDQWGCEESQHGRALARWATMADPSFDLEATFKRFRDGYKPEHFADNNENSIRGSRRGEMIARCVVESGTSSYYSAIRDASDEPVLKEIAARIASDEYRHYKLFYDTLKAQDEPELPFWRKMWVAVGRVTESDDDEIAYAFYCANVRKEDEAAAPYSRAKYTRESFAVSMSVYKPGHIKKLVQMVAVVIGAHPQGWLARTASTLMWRMMRARAGLTAAA